MMSVETRRVTVINSRTIIFLGGGLENPALGNFIKIQGFFMQIASKEIVERNLKEVKLLLNYLDSLKILSQEEYIQSFDDLFNEAEKELNNKKDECLRNLKTYTDADTSQIGQ